MFDDELRKLRELQPAMSEAHMMTNHVDWLTQVRSHFVAEYPSFTDTLGRHSPPYAESVPNEDHDQG